MMPTSINTIPAIELPRTSAPQSASGTPENRSPDSAPPLHAAEPLPDKNTVANLQQAQQEKQSAEADKQQAEQAAEKLQKLLQTKITSLSFSVDQDSGRYVVKITDSDTNEVLRQIPSKEALELAKAIDHLLGVFVDNRA